jgi:hypothetical protein
MARPFKDDRSSALLLLEGLNDCHVVAALCEFHQVPESFKIFDSESETKAIKKLSALLDSAEGAIPLDLGTLMEIKVNFLDNLRLEAKFDDFTVIADQPIRYKGDGSAPGPFDYFLASSALCAAYFVQVILPNAQYIYR